MKKECDQCATSEKDPQRFFYQITIEHENTGTSLKINLCRECYFNGFTPAVKKYYPNLRNTVLGSKDDDFKANFQVMGEAPWK